MKNKLGFTAGILNIILGVVLCVDGIILAIAAFACLLMSFSLFFMAAVPAFFVTGFICVVAFCAAAVNAITGVGAVITSINGGKISKVFYTISSVADIATIPANGVAVAFCAMLLVEEVSGLAIFLTVFAALAICLAAASLIMNLYCVTRTKKQTMLYDI